MQIREELRQFRKDPRDYRLCLLATTPKVHAADGNLFDQARLVLDR